MVDAIKKLGNMIVTAVNLDFDADDSAATSTYSDDDSKPLPELPSQNQTQAKEQSTDIQAPARHLEREEETSPFRVDEAEVSKHQHANLKIVIERKVQIPSSLVDQVNVVFPSLTEDIKEALGVDYAKTAPEVPAPVDEHQNQPGFKRSKASSPELYTDLPTDFTLEMKSLRQEVTEEVREFGGGYYLHPKKIVDIPPELSHQVRTLHDTLNQEVPHGAEHLHPKEIVEIPPELSQNIRALHEALSQEVENGPDVLHPKELLEIPPELSPEIRELQNELKAEVKFGADVLHPKKIVEIPADLGQEAQELHGALNEEVKQFGDLNHLHPKQIVEIPKELSQEVEKMHEALNEEVIQAGGPGQLHPKQIVEIPAEITPQIRELHADLTEEVTYVGGRHILHPKVIAEVPAELSDEVKYLHEDLNSEVKEIGSTVLHPKQIAVIPKDLCQEVKEAHIFVNEDIKNGAQVLHPKEIVEIPSDLNQQTRELHEGLNVEVELFGGASRLQKEDRTLEPPKELSESVKEILPSLATEIKEFNGPHKLHYYCIPNQNKEHPGTTPKLDIDSFQTHVEQMLLLFGAADSGTDLSASSKPDSGNPVLDECVENVVNALVEATKKLRGPMTDTDVLVEELHRRRSIIDVDDGAPAKEQNAQVLEDQPLVGEPANLENAEQRENGKTDSGLADQEQNVEEPAMAPITEDDKEVLKKPNIMRRLSGWKASHATLNDEDASDGAYTHAKGMENAKGNDTEDVKRPGRKMSWNPFRKHHKHHADVASVPVV